MLTLIMVNVPHTIKATIKAATRNASAQSHMASP